eukprot:tig00021127_g18862.t1
MELGSLSRVIHFLAVGRFSDRTILLLCTTDEEDDNQSRAKALQMLMGGGRFNTGGPKIEPSRFTVMDFEDGLLHYYSDAICFYAAGTSPSMPSKPAFKLLKELKGALSGTNMAQTSEFALRPQLRNVRALIDKHEKGAKQWDSATAARSKGMEEHRVERETLLAQEREMNSWRSFFKFDGMRQQGIFSGLKLGTCCAAVCLSILGIIALIIALKIFL